MSPDRQDLHHVCFLDQEYTEDQLWLFWETKPPKQDEWMMGYQTGNVDARRKKKHETGHPCEERSESVERLIYRLFLAVVTIWS